MSRKIFVPSPINPYHITGRCINKNWFELPMKEVWEIMENQLYFISHAYGVKIISFVLMHNHFHLLAIAPNSNISQAMQYFMRETSRIITKKSHRINQTWGSRFHRSEITSYFYFLSAYKYVYRNPLEAGICSKLLEYPFSTLMGKLGQQKIIIPVQEDLLLFNSDLRSTLTWLDKTPTKEQIEYVRKALRKKVFKYSKIENRPNPLETSFI